MKNIKLFKKKKKKNINTVSQYFGMVAWAARRNGINYRLTYS